MRRLQICGAFPPTRPPSREMIAARGRGGRLGPSSRLSDDLWRDILGSYVTGIGSIAAAACSCRRLRVVADDDVVLFQASLANVRPPSPCPSSRSKASATARRVLRGLEKLHAAGHIEATFCLGLLVMFCCEGDTRGPGLIRDAAAAGHLDALYHQAIMECDASLLRLAASMGHGPSQFEMRLTRGGPVGGSRRRRRRRQDGTGGDEEPAGGGGAAAGGAAAVADAGAAATSGPQMAGGGVVPINDENGAQALLDGPSITRSWQAMYTQGGLAVVRALMLAQMHHFGVAGRDTCQGGCGKYRKASSSSSSSSSASSSSSSSSSRQRRHDDRADQHHHRHRRHHHHHHRRRDEAKTPESAAGGPPVTVAASTTAPNLKVRLWRCGHCRSAGYCSRLCQLKDLDKRHHVVCRLLTGSLPLC